MGCVFCKGKTEAKRRVCDACRARLTVSDAPSEMAAPPATAASASMQECYGTATYETQGDIAVAQGRLTEAAEAYRLAIAHHADKLTQLQAKLEHTLNPQVLMPAPLPTPAPDAPSAVITS